LPSAAKPGEVLSFADYEFGPNRILSRHGVRLRLKHQSAQILALLLERAGEVVTRDEIRENLWGRDTFVDFEQGINNCIREVRSNLHDRVDQPRYIETVAKLGYRFLAPVTRRPAVVRQVAESLTEAHPADTASAVLDSPAGSDVDETPSPAALYSRKTFARPFLSVAAIVLIILGAGIWTFLRSRRPLHAAETGRPSIAILPFANSTGVPENLYLSEGVTESVIDDMGRLGASDLTVIARTSSNAYTGSAKPVAQIGRELGVDYIVQGQVQSEGNHLLLTASLVRTQDAQSLWTYKSERATSDIMGADLEITQDVLRKLSIKQTAAAPTSASNPSHVNSDAYRLYLLGRHDLNARSRDSLHRATQEFKDAIEEEPDFAPAYAGLADADNLLAFYGGTDFYKAVVEAEEQARHAIQIDGSLAEAHTALAYSEFMWGWRWPQSEEEFQRGLALNPNYATAHHWYALYLAAMGRFPEARKEIHTAEQLDPLSPIVYAGGAYVNYMARDYDGAIQQAGLALALNPKLMAAHAVLGWTYSASGVPEKAILEFRTADGIAGGSNVYRAGLGSAYALAGHPESARKVLAMLPVGPSYVGNYSLRAEVVESLGERDDAITLLYKAYEENDSSALWLKVDPQYDSLRSDPKFQDLLRRMAFPN
jgi:TolB-like protein/DNA-binding winged helix-turn-helix (wHTH) protein/tetratricopeptide (TPR) repeat protein